MINVYLKLLMVNKKLIKKINFSFIFKIVHNFFILKNAKSVTFS